MTQYVLAAQAATGSILGSPIVMLVLLFVIMYFFMIRPQQKRQKEIAKFQNSLEKGTQVITSGGIYGKVKNVDLVANKVDLEIASGVVITVDKNYVFSAPQDIQAK